MPDCYIARLFLHIGTGAHKAEDPVCVLAQRRPGLLAVDDIMIAIQHRGGFQGGKVRSCPRLGIPLAPPIHAAQDARQKALALLLSAKGQ